MNDGKEFEHQHMDGTLFRDCSMARSKYEDINLSDSTFLDCSMARSKYEDINLSDSVFSKVDLRRAKLTNVNLAGVLIEDANIDGLTIFGHDVQALIRAEIARKSASTKPE